MRVTGTRVLRVLDYLLYYSSIYSLLVYRYNYARTGQPGNASTPAAFPGLASYRYSYSIAIKGERTRVEKQMLGGGFRALYR